MSKAFSGLSLNELLDIAEEQMKRTKRSFKKAERAVKKAQEAHAQINWGAVIGLKALDAEVIIIQGEA